MSKTVIDSDKAKIKKQGKFKAKTSDAEGWSLENEQKLALLVEKSDEVSWIKIGKQLAKPATDCQAKWQEILKRESKKGNWTEEEDEQLRNWVGFFLITGGRTWTRGMDLLRQSDSRQERQAVQRAVGQHSRSSSQNRRLV